MSTLNGINEVTILLKVIMLLLLLLLGWRGYTGHKHLPMFGLVNMNARLYDLVIGRFLSPDMRQNFNRYSYALNNPLRYTDSNEEFFGVPVVLLAGGFLTGYVAYGIGSRNWEFSAVVTGWMNMVMSASCIGLKLLLINISKRIQG